jgi:hypothetical protein
MPSSYWQWAEKPLDSELSIPADIHHAVMSLPPEERRDRAKVNEAMKWHQGRTVNRCYRLIRNACSSARQYDADQECNCQ